MSETIEVQGIEFDAEDLTEAVEDIRAQTDEVGNIESGYAVVGSVAIAADGFDDGDVAVANVEDIDSVSPTGLSHNGTYAFIGLSSLEELVSDDSFEDYVRENVFTSGTYTYEDSDKYDADIRVAEHDDGGGFTCPECVVNAAEDDNVSVIGIKNGWLHLSDER
jgi:hypothetical protein